MKRNSTVFLAILLWSAGFGASLGDSNAVLDTGDVYKAERCSAAVAHP